MHLDLPLCLCPPLLSYHLALLPSPAFRLMTAAQNKNTVRSLRDTGCGAHPALATTAGSACAALPQPIPHPPWHLGALTLWARPTTRPGLLPNVYHPYTQISAYGLHYRLA